MVVLGGGVHERISSAVDLMLAGACGDLMLTGAGSEEEARALLDELGGVPIRFQIEVASSESTMEDAADALRGAKLAGFRSVLVVTSPYHSRRAAWIFSRVFAGSGIAFGIHPSDSFYFDYRQWWKTRDGRGVVLGEYAKLVLCGMLSDILVGWVGELV
jgi:uncharacterized SAM-binding protein YcdF (DUF218 family)